ncbi:MAG: cell division protein FtsB [Gammaproteobacteria bacterium]
MKIVIAILALILLWLQFQLWFGDDGIRGLLELQRQVEALTEENAQAKERNKALAAEVTDLKTGKEAIEERARSQLGMIKEGETFYQVVEPEKTEESN